MGARTRKSLKGSWQLIAIGAIGYLLVLLIRSFISAIEGATPTVVAAVIGAMATTLVGISAVLISKARERKQAAEEAHRLKKVEIYQAFIDTITRMLGSGNKNLTIKEINPQELANYLFKFKSDLLLWGSPKVIQAQIAFETGSGSGDTQKIFKSVNAIYLAIRDDLGLSNSGLNNLELIKLFLNEEARSSL